MADKWAPNHDSAAYSQVGKLSLGDLEIVMMVDISTVSTYMIHEGLLLED